MLVLCEGSATELFVGACRAVRDRGKSVAPRGLATVEVLGAHLILTEPRRRFVDVPPTRVLNPAFAVAEAVWILAGSDDPWIYEYNGQLAAYADNHRLMGAYGPRLRRWHGTIDQLDRVRRTLTEDPSSRRAVVQLFDPARDFDGHKDVPCTLGYRFYLRDGQLHMHTTMRSQDLWLGFGYDIFTATLVQELLAGWLGVRLGEYHHSIDSLHLYQRDVPAARELPLTAEVGPAMPEVTVAWEGFDDILRCLVAGEPVPQPGWAELGQVMESYRAWKLGHPSRARHLAGRGLGPLAQALERWYDHLELSRDEPAPARANR